MAANKRVLYVGKFVFLSMKMIWKICLWSKCSNDNETITLYIAPLYKFMSHITSIFVIIGFWMRRHKPWQLFLYFVFYKLVFFPQRSLDHTIYWDVRVKPRRTMGGNMIISEISKFDLIYVSFIRALRVSCTVVTITNEQLFDWEMK